MKHNILMVSDFFYPHPGGMETHIYSLSQCLLSLKHKVVIMTHKYDHVCGVRYLNNLLKVYYIPVPSFYNNSIFPSLFGCTALIRDIIMRENITILHGHGSFSALANEALMQAKTMGIFTVFTDHSLFGFADLSSVIMKKVLELSLLDADHVICVSHTSKENTVLRASLAPMNVSVIPNAIDSCCFVPPSSAESIQGIVIVVVSRLVHRKGADLLLSIIPRICEEFDDARFIIAGDGPKLTDLIAMCKFQNLNDRVQILGSVSHKCVRDVLVKGNIFLNCSLTEAFCIAIVEAASCGLLVVSTKVGGIPEVLPSPEVLILAEANTEDLICALKVAIRRVKDGDVIDKWLLHSRIKEMYDWMCVARRTERVYDNVVSMKVSSLPERICRHLRNGFVSGFVWTICVLINFVYIQFLNLIFTYF